MQRENINLRIELWGISSLKGQGKEDEPLRKQRECSNRTKMLSFTGEKKGECFKGQMNGSKAKMFCGDCEKVLRFSVSFPPLHLPHSQPLKPGLPGATITLTSKIFPTEMNMVEERKHRARKAYYEVYLSE